MRKFILFIVFLFPYLAFADNLDPYLLDAMKTYKVPVVGYAIIDDFKIVSIQTISIDPAIKVNTHSLFQAASISKSLSAYGALKLVENNKIKLDEPANSYLKKWKINESLFGNNHPVYIRNLMDMTSGLSVSGFAGYKQDQKMPNLLQILKGEAPANNLPIKLFYAPGSQYFYSGGAFEVLQEVIEEVSGQPFETYMNQKILKSLEMNDSIFQYPLNASYEKLAIPAIDGWKNYPELAAAGLWSTPNDLAKFILSLSESYLGKSNSLSKKLAQQMLTRHKNTDFGLGVVVGGKGKNLYFWKAGHNQGYHSLMIMFPKQGKGLVFMTNSETGNELINYIVPIVAHDDHWPYYFPFFDELIMMPDF